MLQCTCSQFSHQFLPLHNITSRRRIRLSPNTIPLNGQSHSTSMLILRHTTQLALLMVCTTPMHVWLRKLHLILMPL
jgi:hypothetical protein